jgi:hypothetical protein
MKSEIHAAVASGRKFVNYVTIYNVFNGNLSALDSELGCGADGL